MCMTATRDPARTGPRLAPLVGRASRASCRLARTPTFLARWLCASAEASVNHKHTNTNTSANTRGRSLVRTRGCSAAGHKQQEGGKELSRGKEVHAHLALREQRCWKRNASIGIDARRSQHHEHRHQHTEHLCEVQDAETAHREQHRWARHAPRSMRRRRTRDERRVTLDEQPVQRRIEREELGGPTI